jgi:hypothetical protein
MFSAKLKIYLIIPKKCCNFACKFNIIIEYL